MIIELLFFGLVAFIVLIPVISDNPNEVLGEIGDKRLNRQPSKPRSAAIHALAEELPVEKRGARLALSSRCSERVEVKRSA